MYRTAKQRKSDDRSAQQEKELASRYGGKVVRQSGAGIEKGDIRVQGEMRIEAKITKHSSYRVTNDTLCDVEMAAAATGEMPVLIVGLENEIETFAILPIEAFNNLLDKSRK